MDKTQNTLQDLLGFLDRSPTPFHAVSEMAKALDQAGFERLAEEDDWQDRKPGPCYTIRNGSTIVAIKPGPAPVEQAGLRIVGAHTDSPCLKIKPSPEIQHENMWQLGVEVYGGALLNPWFDRDLSLAGRVSWQGGHGKLHHSLVNLQQPIGVIPSLAIHLDREANDNRKINAQTDLPPLLMLNDDRDNKPDLRQLLCDTLRQQGDDAKTVLEYELCLYDTQPAAILGWNRDFIASARLDNLLSCYVGMHSLVAAEGEATMVLVCNDHEEVGSQSAAGAQGPMLESVLQRLYPGLEQRSRALARSMLVSTDNAHGLHPNYRDKYDENHGPLLNAGPVIKHNASQRYATNSNTAAVFRQVCRRAGVPLQSFVVRSDMACGGTIGPITAANLGVATLDVGVPTFAMHSIRELAGTRDAASLQIALTEFLSTPVLNL